MLAVSVELQITIAFIATVAGGLVLAGLLWVIRTLMRVREEFTPNGGSSLRDAIDTIVTEGRARDAKLDSVNMKIETHIAEHRGADRGTSGLVRFSD